MLAAYESSGTVHMRMSELISRRSRASHSSCTETLSSTMGSRPQNICFMMSGSMFCTPAVLSTARSNSLPMASTNGPTGVEKVNSPVSRSSTKSSCHSGTDAAG